LIKILPSRMFLAPARLMFSCVSRGLFLLLAMTVFCWGTQYKLSLYHPSEAIHTTPAKLCTRASEIAKDDLHLAFQVSAVDPVLLNWTELFVSVSEPAPSIGCDERSELPIKTCSCQSSPSLYDRPPPVLLRLVV
jgi:hypothetical protein